jgi:two-component system phosphate regulon sensor histidine kinase PhoR
MADASPSDLAVAASLVEALEEPALVVAADDRVLIANAAARARLPTLRLGQQLALALRAPEALAAVSGARAAGAPCVIEWRERAPVERVSSVRAAPLDPALPGAVAMTLHDLTQARRLERMRSEFVANASHELRTPLASLLGFVETLQGPARDDPRARDKFLAVMHEQARRMARLIDDLLSLSRIERHLHVRPSARVDLAEVVAHVADSLAPLAQARGAAIRLEASPAPVAGDRDELVRMAENLIENALKYGLREDRAGETIEVRVGVERGEAKLAVRDYGPGIAPEHLPRLTERFYRVDIGKSRAQGGTGLGLALVKHIVARHGGRLAIDSRLGEGAGFAVTLPALVQ